MTPRKNDTLPDGILWFRHSVRFDIDFFELLRPRREVSHHARYRSGVFRSGKCGRDIQYESALELRFVRLLEADPHVRFYWEQPVKIPYRLGRRSLTYTPDFGICMDTGHVVLAEVKELSEMLDYRVQAKTEALMEFCSKRGFGLLLTDGRHAPDHLIKAKSNRRFEKALLAALDHRPLRQPECRELMQRTKATTAALCKAVIRYDLRFRSFPLHLRHGTGKSLFRQVFFEGLSYEELIDERFLSGIESFRQATPSDASARFSTRIRTESMQALSTVKKMAVK